MENTTEARRAIDIIKKAIADTETNNDPALKIYRINLNLAIAAYERTIQELRDALEASTHPECGWPLMEIAHRFEDSRELVPADLQDEDKIDRSWARQELAADWLQRGDLVWITRDELRDYTAAFAEALESWASQQAMPDPKAIDHVRDKVAALNLPNPDDSRLRARPKGGPTPSE